MLLCIVSYKRRRGDVDPVYLFGPVRRHLGRTSIYALSACANDGPAPSRRCNAGLGCINKLFLPNDWQPLAMEG